VNVGEHAETEVRDGLKPCRLRGDIRLKVCIDILIGGWPLGVKRTDDSCDQNQANNQPNYAADML
jgi:hypothetical protein